MLKQVVILRSNGHPVLPSGHVVSIRRTHNICVRNNKLDINSLKMN
jgi:hypothetical protein